MSSLRRYVVNHLATWLPPTRAYAFKAWLWRFAGVDVASSARLVSSVAFHSSGRIAIGARTFVGHQVTFVGGEAQIVVGEDVDIAPRVLIAAGTHEIDAQGPRTAGRGYSKPVAIEDGAWLGAASTVLGGVTIGRKAMVAAGALVNRDVPPNSVVAGVPAKVIKVLNP